MTKTSATLNGAVNAGSADVGWTFQYGWSLPYGHNTGVVAAGPGLTAVSNTIFGLSPGTTYHFRLAAVEQVDTTIGPSFFVGDHLAFTTRSAKAPGGNKPGSGKTTRFGRAKLVHRRLTVQSGVVSVPFTASGPRACCVRERSRFRRPRRSARPAARSTAGTASSAGRADAARRFGPSCRASARPC